MTRPNPQLIQQAISDTTVTSRIAVPGDFANPANVLNNFMKKGLLANTCPATNTMTICIVKARSPQNPFPQWTVISSGPESVRPMPSKKTSNVRMATNMYGSGKYLSMMVFDHLVNV